ncbi:hypothetical protein ACJX0J_023921, partial [Zea mays]
IEIFPLIDHFHITTAVVLQAIMHYIMYYVPWLGLGLGVKHTDCNGGLFQIPHFKFFIAEDTLNYELLDDDEEENNSVEGFEYLRSPTPVDHLTIFGYGMPTLAFQEDIERAFGVLQSRGDLSEREAFVAAHHNLGDKPQTFVRWIHIEITNSGLALIKIMHLRRSLFEVGDILGTTTFRFSQRVLIDFLPLLIGTMLEVVHQITGKIETQQLNMLSSNSKTENFLPSKTKYVLPIL